MDLTRKATSMAEECGEAALATLDEEGYPYTSLVELLFDGDRHFWLLLSDLAVHTANIKRDVRASLLVRESSDDEAVATARGSFLGRVVESDGDAIRSEYLAMHPHAEQYIDFSDFSFYRFRIERIRIVAGFGKISWIDVEEFGS